MVGNINHCLQYCEECCNDLKNCPGCEDLLERCEQIRQQLIASRDATSGVRGLDYMSLALQLFMILSEVLKKQNLSVTTDPVQAAAEKGFNDAMEK